MATRVELFPPVQEPDVFETDLARVKVEPRGPWDPERFREEQTRSLVRQVFLPGWPKASRQVLFCAVDSNTYTAEICVRVAETLAEQISGSVAVVEANPYAPELEAVFGGTQPRGRIPNTFGSLRDYSVPLSEKVWLVPWSTFRTTPRSGSSITALRDRFGELRLDFDYTILHGPAAGLYNDATVLGHVSDGVVLVLEAGRTRRVAAQKVRDTLHLANARILGSVLSERKFPIPEKIYRRL